MSRDTCERCPATSQECPRADTVHTHTPAAGCSCGRHLIHDCRHDEVVRPAETTPVQRRRPTPSSSGPADQTLHSARYVHDRQDEEDGADRSPYLIVTEARTPRDRFRHGICELCAPALQPGLAKRDGVHPALIPVIADLDRAGLMTRGRTPQRRRQPGRGGVQFPGTRSGRVDPSARCTAELCWVSQAVTVASSLIVARVRRLRAGLDAGRDAATVPWVEWRRRHATHTGRLGY